jgi:hypothetical protein
MRLIHVILGAALLSGGAAAAQNKTPKPLTDAGNGALMFQLGGIFASTPSILDGVGVGGRYFISDGTAIRAAVGLVHSSVETDPEGGGGNTDDSSTDFAIEGGLELPLFQRGPVYLYWGGIAQILVGSTDTESNDQESSTKSIGVAGMVGANWFFDDSMSLGAEYRLGFSYKAQTVERPAGDVDVNTLTLGTGAVAFHLGFWF